MIRHRDGHTPAADELSVPRSIVHQAVNGRLGILTSDAVHDPRFRSRASVRASQVRSALCAPLWGGDDVLGVIYLDSRVQTRAFTPDDLLLLTAIANLIALRLKQEALTEELVRERIVRAGLERYHSPDVVEAILSRTAERGVPELGLEEREVTILFADLTGLTRLAESVAPAVVAEGLNEYYTVATRIMFEHGGSVNEYVGDSVMAIFGAPVACEDHAQRAVDAAGDLIRELVRRSGGDPESFGSRVRIAINTGNSVVGTLGSPNRLKYAVVGDPVNVAARLEGIGEPNTITLGEETARRLTADLPLEDLGLQQLRGRQKPVRAYRLRPVTDPGL